MPHVDPPPPDLSIVVINWNRSAETRACLARLAEWTRLRPAVWVVDNASSDGAERIAAEFPDVRLIKSATNLGFGGGNNRALEQIEGGHVLLLNNDARIDEDSVLRLIEALDRRPDLAIVGPVFTVGEPSHRVVAAGGRNIARHVGTHLDPAAVPRELLHGSEPYEVDYVPGTAALLRAGLLDEIGRFDEAYFFSGEMADLCERARQAGHGVAVVPAAKASHDTLQASGLRVSLYPYYILRNRFLYVRKRERRWRVPLFLFWGAYGVFATLRALASGDRRGARLAALALVDGLGGRFGDQNERVLAG